MIHQLSCFLVHEKMNERFVRLLHENHLVTLHFRSGIFWLRLRDNGSNKNLRNLVKFTLNFNFFSSKGRRGKIQN